MVVLDAGTLEEVARVHLPRRVPFGFHGSFLPAPTEPTDPLVPRVR